MRALVDTHAFLWMLLGDPRMSAKAKQVLRSEENELYFSLVSLWEISIKMKLGRLNARGSSVEYIRDEMNTFGLELLPIRYEHVVQLERLPAHHGEPFDRLLIAQASFESLPIVTRDAEFAKYPIKTIW